ncbi:MAG: TrkA C-terminal domain-containing protein [Candidatus Omnitrophota bacterium]
MGALFALLTIIILSITVVRIGAVAFELTGLSPDVAAFQAQSAFSGAGFTTSEAESIVTHPVRRKIARLLILLGSAGFTSTIATFILTFINQSGETILLRGTILVAGIVLIYIFVRSRFVYQGMKRVITWALKKTAALKIFDYQELLGLSRGYTISKIRVRENSWIEGCSLQDLKLHLEGILIIAIQRTTNGDEKFIGVPTADTDIHAGDTLTCYGPGKNIEELARRSKGALGDQEHQEKATEKRDQDAEESFYKKDLQEGSFT